MQVEEKIKEHLEDILSGESNLFVVKVSLSGQRGNQMLRVAMDGDEGITIDQCASVSRQLGARIEEEDLIEDKFRLEVSSAGLETPLLLERQYDNNVGRKLQVTLKNGEVKEGILIAKNGKMLELGDGAEKHQIDFKEIEKSVIMISFK